jgi:hypothetical protein
MKINSRARLTFSLCLLSLLSWPKLVFSETAVDANKQIFQIEDASDGGGLEKNWEKLRERYDYTEETEEPKKNEVKERSENRNLNLDMGAFRILAYIGVGALLLLLLYYLVKNASGGAWRNQKLKTTFDLENPDQLERTELEKAMDEALRNGDLAKAIRVHFLMLLESLESRKLIVWHKYKTNGEYLRELNAYEDKAEVQDLTRAYEYFWYGEYTLTQAIYDELAQRFKHKISKLKRNE